jgi:hypothetical protein
MGNKSPRKKLQRSIQRANERQRRRLQCGINTSWDLSVVKRNRQQLLREDLQPGAGYIYLMQVGNTDQYKLGCSTNPQQRLKRLRAANPDLRLTLQRRVSHMRQAELALHEHLWSTHVAGEFFKLSPAQVHSVGCFLDDLSPASRQ